MAARGWRHEALEPADHVARREPSVRRSTRSHGRCGWPRAQGNGSSRSGPCKDRVYRGNVRGPGRDAEHRRVVGKRVHESLGPGHADAPWSAHGSRSRLPLGRRFREGLTAQEGFARYVAPESYTEAGLRSARTDSIHRIRPRPGGPAAPAGRGPGTRWSWRPGGYLAGRTSCARPARPSDARQGETARSSGVRGPRGRYALLVGHDRLDNVPLPGLEIEGVGPADRRLAIGGAPVLYSFSCVCSIDRGGCDRATRQ